MKTHLLYPFALFAAILTAALATGNALLLMIALLIILSVITALVSVLWASATVKISVSYTEQTIHRGEDTFLVMQIRHSGWIPISPILLSIPSMVGEKDREIRLRDMPGRIQKLQMPVHGEHIGVFVAGIRSCTVEDLFGFFSRTVTFPESIFELTVLPLTFPTEPLLMAPGDPGSEIMARATEDVNAPSDIRAYQPGDAMKKIHWKLSLRKGELIVRKFDEPLLQDVLILLDCSRPPTSGSSLSDLYIRDALIETAASVFTDQMKTSHPVRMPLSGTKPAEADRKTGTATALEYLSHTDFSAVERFERVLQMESRNVRKVGCIAVITARLSYAMIDIMIRFFRSGPNLRLYLITPFPDNPDTIPLISRLKQAGIEVSYVKPDLPEEQSISD